VFFNCLWNRGAICSSDIKSAYSINIYLYICDCTAYSFSTSDNIYPRACIL